MKILDYIKDDSIIIIPNNIKEKVLLEIDSKDKFMNIKFMSLDEFKSEYYFNYDKEAILYIMDNYNLEVDISSIIMDLLYYVDINNKYDDEKLLFLNEIKKSLIEKNLIVFNSMFKDYISKKQIFVYGYSKLNKFLSNMLDNVNAIKIDTPKYEKNSKVNVLNTLEDEVEYVFNEISFLLYKGIELNKIKLVNVSSKYLYSIKRISKMYSIPITFNKTI